MAPSPVRSPRLTREDWTAAALAALAAGGLDAVAIEPLASQLGATKGSGYWHFANRAALVEATVARWELEYTDRIIAEVERHDSPVAKLRALFHAVIGGPRAHLPGLPYGVETALLTHAGDPAVGPTLTRVTEHRIDYIRGLLTDIGFDVAEAQRRALLAYSSYLGHAHLARIGHPTIATEHDVDSYIESVLAVLTYVRPV